MVGMTETCGSSAILLLNKKTLDTMPKSNTLRGLLALSPIVVLLTIYLIGSIIAGDFYRIPIAVAFLVSSMYAISITKGHTLNERIDLFSKASLW